MTRWNRLIALIAHEEFDVRMSESLGYACLDNKRNLARLLNFRDSKNLNQFYMKKRELPPRRIRKLHED